MDRQPLGSADRVDLNGTHSLYLAGTADQPTEWRQLFDREIAPLGLGFLKAYVTDDVAETVFAGYPLKRRERVLYRGGLRAITDWRQRRPDGVTVSAIDDRLIDTRAFANAADVIAHIESCWNSWADFRRHGFGFLALDAGAIACWCTTEYLSAGKCGIGIETVADYQGRGYATLTASAFIEYCGEQGITPHWDAWTSNLPSVAVAEKIGLQKVETYSIFVCDFGDVTP